MSEELKNNAQALKKFQEETVSLVLNQIKDFEENGALDLPKDYSAANALKAAWFSLLKTKDRNNGLAIDVCTKNSIANSLLEMATQGLNPAKHQCSFIVYGKELQLQREYFGSIALAKRYNPSIVSVTAHVIYQKDVFEYGIDTKTGKKVLISHKQDLENIDISKIKGAYGMIIFEDGTHEIEPMTYAQIVKAWEQGSMKGKSGAHINFTDQMCKKTAINRICKPYINASDDSELVNSRDNEQPIPDENTTELQVETNDIEYVDVTEKPLADNETENTEQSSKVQPKEEHKAEPKVEPKAEPKVKNEPVKQEVKPEPKVSSKIDPSVGNPFA